VDDTFTIIKKEHSTEFVNYLNTIDECIQWTTEEESVVVKDEQRERQLAFLDTMVVAADDGTTHTKVFRKETHTDQYLNFMSNHPVEHKRGVVRTLYHRAECVVSREADLQQEMEYIQDMLKVNGYPEWILKGRSTSHENNPKPSGSQPHKKRQPVVIPYIKGVSEQLRRVFKEYEIVTYFKPFNTIRQMLVRPKDKITKERTVCPVYHINCDGCDASYVGETER
jgi:hypothetical protein